MAGISPCIQFSCISYRQIILVTHQTEPENYTNIVSGILAQISHIPGRGERKFTCPVDRFQFHMLIDNDSGIAYSCITERTDRHLLPFTFLDTLKTKFHGITSLVQRAPTAGENEFDRDFAPVLAAVVFNFNSGQGDKLSRLELQVHDVKRIILTNVEKLIERGEKLDELIVKSENLAATSVGFRQGAQELRRQQRCKDWKMWVVICALLGSLLTVALLIASGVIRL